MAFNITTFQQLDISNGHIIYVPGGIFPHLSRFWNCAAINAYLSTLGMSVFIIPIIFYYRYNLIVKWVPCPPEWVGRGGGGVSNCRSDFMGTILHNPPSPSRKFSQCLIFVKFSVLNLFLFFSNNFWTYLKFVRKSKMPFDLLFNN